ncbi:MAG: hypothetical protein SGBAC_007926, partial [Bacillariaceae sp.]
MRPRTSAAMEALSILWNTKIVASLSHPTTVRTTSVSLFSTASTVTADTVTSPKEVSTVSVCTAELCNCQEEGFSGDDILEALRSKNLPYSVEDAPCLGAC